MKRLDRPTATKLFVKTKLSKQAKLHEVLVRKKARRWHAALAGALAGGLAVLWETKERRLGIAQQLFVRYALIQLASCQCLH